jgi:hypothetical protein
MGSPPIRDLVVGVATAAALEGDAEVKLLRGTAEAEIAAALTVRNRGAMTNRLVLQRTDPMERHRSGMVPVPLAHPGVILSASEGSRRRITGLSRSLRCFAFPHYDASAGSQDSIKRSTP